MTLEPGTRLGKYELLRQLGSGAMGIVYEAKHLTLGHHVAIKVLQQLASNGEGVIRRFEQEARIVARLESRHIVRVLDADQAPDGTRYLVMELMRGRDLSAIVNERHALRTEEVVDVALQVCAGLKHAHEAGIVHRDLKPANLFVAENDEGTTVKIMDFGISKDLASGTNEQTASNIMIGTPNYMSPEQIRTSRSVDERSDLWSLGVIMYRLLAGCHPFTGDNHGAVLVSIATDTPLDVRGYAQHVPDGLAKIIMQLLEKNPARRPSSAAKLGRILLPFAPPFRDYPTFETVGSPDTVRNSSPLSDVRGSITTQIASTVPSPEVEITEMPPTAAAVTVPNPGAATVPNPPRPLTPPAPPSPPSALSPTVKGPPSSQSSEEATLDTAAIEASRRTSGGAPSMLRKSMAPLAIAAIATLLGGGAFWWRSSAHVSEGGANGTIGADRLQDASMLVLETATPSAAPTVSTAPSSSNAPPLATAPSTAPSTLVAPSARPTARLVVPPPATGARPTAVPSASVTAPTHIR